MADETPVGRQHIEDAPISDISPAETNICTEKFMSRLSQTARQPNLARPNLAMASQPSPFVHNSNASVPQKLLRLTGSYNPAPPPASWRRPQRQPDAA
ncbi:MAG: hypothetical protein AB1586_21885 [Pseudomonadota bacterium]